MFLQFFRMVCILLRGHFHGARPNNQSHLQNYQINFVHPNLLEKIFVLLNIYLMIFDFLHKEKC